MTSTFSDYPTMPTHDFDLYSSTHESYPDYLSTTSQPYIPPTSFMDGPYTSALASLDSFNQPYSTTPKTQSYQPNPYTPPVGGSPNMSAPHALDNQPPNLTSSESGTSIHSTSTTGSPSLHPQYPSWDHLGHGLGLAPGIVPQDSFSGDAFTSGIEQDPIISTDKLSGFVDPNSLMNPFPSPIPYSSATYPDLNVSPSPRIPFFEHPPSPAPSNTSGRSQTVSDSRRFKRPGSQSPYLHTSGFQPYHAPYQASRRPSASSIHSRHSQNSRHSGSFEGDEESREKGLCPIPDCGRIVKDLKAHLLTHQSERPEKCPIITCEFHHKGFARKYDKNRHTLTHYKGTMVCGFCPGSGSAAEKSFNRADVFKRHLTSVHGVEQTPPNSRKKSPHTSKKGYSGVQSTAGTCSTCNVTFANAQEFYEHLDDCVLRVVQQADPSEAINQKHLTSISDDKAVQETLDLHCLSSVVDYSAPTYDEPEDDEEAEYEPDDADDATYGSRPSRAGKGSIKSKRHH